VTKQAACFAVVRGNESIDQYREPESSGVLKLSTPPFGKMLISAFKLSVIF